MITLFIGAQSPSVPTNSSTHFEINLKFLRIYKYLDYLARFTAYTGLDTILSSKKRILLIFKTTRPVFCETQDACIAFLSYIYQSVFIHLSIPICSLYKSLRRIRTLLSSVWGQIRIDGTNYVYHHSFPRLFKIKKQLYPIQQSRSTGLQSSTIYKFVKDRHVL